MNVKFSLSKLLKKNTLFFNTFWGASSPIYTYVADTFEMVADRNYVMVDTFNRRLEVSATWRNFYWR